MERQEQAIDVHPVMAGMGIAVLWAAGGFAIVGVALVALAVSASEASVALRLGCGGAGAALLALVGGVLWSLRRSAWGRDTLRMGAAGLVVGAVCLAASPLVLRAGGWARGLTGVEPGQLVRAFATAFALPILWRGARRVDDHLSGVVAPALLAWPVALALSAAIESPASPRGALFLPLLYTLVAVGAASSLVALRRWLAAASALVAYGLLALAAASGQERDVAGTLMLAGVVVSVVRGVLARRRARPEPAAR